MPPDQTTPGQLLPRHQHPELLVVLHPPPVIHRADQTLTEMTVTGSAMDCIDMSRLRTDLVVLMLPTRQTSPPGDQHRTAPSLSPGTRPWGTHEHKYREIRIYKPL